ncbi:hypothetical protein PM082_002959 [Marasmius tenuissimus]|nr:hypothetical protein PM082_002959 [Marasmius tenuissimus]
MTATMMFLSTLRHRFSDLRLSQRAAHAKSFSQVLREPSNSAPRLVPTPLVFVSASEWHAPNRFRHGFARMYPEKGYTCLDVDIHLPAEGTNQSETLMEYFVSELRSAIRLTTIPFAPVIFARDAACLIAQTYISSHPATGLVLISPPPSNDAAMKSGILPTPLPEYDFEPTFPIVVVSTPSQMEVLRKEHRLLRDPQAVDTIVVDDVEGQDAFVKIEEWSDRIGV